jgi:hypothetical protein
MKLTSLSWEAKAGILLCTTHSSWLLKEKSTMKTTTMPVITYCMALTVHATINRLPHLHGAN